LIGQYLSFKKRGLSPIEQCDHFYSWLKECGGIHSGRHSIVQAIAMKCNVMFPGIYDESVYK